MLFQFSRFWQNYGFTSALDTVLEKKDCTLERILDEENILQELKNSGATKFAKFIIAEPSRYEQMIDYVINYQDEKHDTRTQIRYPFLVSECFSAENTALIDFLFKPAEEAEEAPKGDVESTTETTTQFQSPAANENENKRQQLLPRLLNFLDQDSICVTSAGYFNKTVVPIIKKRGYDFWKYLVEHPQCLSNFVKHLDVTHIADLIQKLLILDTQNELVSDNYMTHRIRLLQRIMQVSQMRSHIQPIVENVATILSEIVYQGLNVNTAQAKELVALIEEINRPFKIFQFGVQTQSAQVLQVVVNLLEWTRQRANPKKDEDDVTYQDAEEESQFNFNAYHEIPEQLPKALLARSFTTPAIVTTYGENIIPVNPAKLNLINILYQLLQQTNHQNNLRTGDQVIFQRIAESHVFKVIQDLVLQHQFNNQLQIYLEKMITMIFENSNAAQLQENILEDGFLVFLATNNDNKVYQTGSMKNAVKKGYQGVLTKLSNNLARLPRTHTAFQKVSESDLTVWGEYVKQTLKQINDVESVFLCGINPKAKQTQEEQDIHENEVQSILSRFQMKEQSEPAEQPPQEELEVFQDANEGDTPNDSTESNPSAETNATAEEIQEQIEQVIHRQDSGPEEMGQLIEQQENLETKEHVSQNEIENKSDAEVNDYWKTHDQNSQKAPEQSQPQQSQPAESEEEEKKEPEQEVQPPVKEEAVVQPVQQEEPEAEVQHKSVPEVEETKEDQTQAQE